MSTTMPTTDSADPRGTADLPGWVKGSWISILALGLLMLVLGVLLISNLAASVNTLRWLVVFSLFLAAIEAFGTASLHQRRWVGWLVGLAYLAGAVVAVAWPGVTLLALTLTVGISLLAGGVAQAGWRGGPGARRPGGAGPSRWACCRRSRA